MRTKPIAHASHVQLHDHLGAIGTRRTGDAPLRETMRRDDMRKRYADMGMQAAFFSRAETTAFIAGEIEKLGPVVKAAGVRLE